MGVGEGMGQRGRIGRGRHHRGRRGGRGTARIVVKITNKDNPEQAARMASLGFCGIVIGGALLIPGCALTGLGAALGTFHLFIGAALIGVSVISLVGSLLLCLLVVKPSCCYPNDPVVGTSVGGRLVTGVDPNVSVVTQQPTNGQVMTVNGVAVQSQTANPQLATNYGNAYGQPMGQTPIGTMPPPPHYQQQATYPPSGYVDPAYPPPPPAVY